MFDEMQTKVQEYLDGWKEFAATRSDQDYFEQLQPTAIGWKFTDRKEVMDCFTELRDMCEQAHFGWINERWVISIYFKDVVLPGNIKVVKLMERRPGSTDAIGLDHVDFYTTDEAVKDRVSAEPDLQWNEEANGAHCKWISVWFDKGEAKLRNDTVLKVCADEMLEYEQRIIGA